MKQIVFITLLALASSARAETKPQPIISCWDHTYAYGTLSVTPVEGQDGLWAVEMSSEQQDFLKEIAISKPAGWGNGKLSFDVGAKECVLDTAHKDVVSCTTSKTLLTVDYQESFESRRILTLLAKQITLKTTQGEHGLTAEITFTPDGTDQVKKATMGFPSWGRPGCWGFSN